MGFLIHFIRGATVESTYTDKQEWYVQFIDNRSKLLLHDGIITNNMWIKCNYEYFIDYKIRILESKTRKLIQEVKFDATDKRIFIAFDSKSLGDNLGWIPFVEEFRIRYKCKMICSTFFNNIFKQTYPDIEFVAPGTTVHNLYAMYEIGCYDNKYRNKVPWNTLNNQEIASNILGLEFKETKPIISITKASRPIQDTYVCISPASTSGCKLWNLKDGWKNLIEFLLKLNYKVVVLGQDKEEKHLNPNIIYPDTKNIHDFIRWANHCEFFVGLCSGGAWLAWTLNKPVVMIGGFSNDSTEFFTPYRVINKNGCYGCWNDTNYVFDKGNWDWCPRLKGTNRQFECSTGITLQNVINTIITLRNNLSFSS